MDLFLVCLDMDFMATCGRKPHELLRHLMCEIDGVWKRPAEKLVPICLALLCQPTYRLRFGNIHLLLRSGSWPLVYFFNPNPTRFACFARVVMFEAFFSLPFLKNHMHALVSCNGGRTTPSRAPDGPQG
jgi:hypothetical protein